MEAVFSVYFILKLPHSDDTMLCHFYLVQLYTRRLHFSLKIDKPLLIQSNGRACLICIMGALVFFLSGYNWLKTGTPYQQFFNTFSYVHILFPMHFYRKKYTSKHIMHTYLGLWR